MKVFKQKNAPTCGPRSIQTVLAYFNIYPSYCLIKHVCETDGAGTVLSKIKEAAGFFGLNTEMYLDDDVNIEVIENNLDSGALVMVHWFTGKNTTHIATAYKYDDSYIYLVDTASHLYTEPSIKMRKDMLKKCWKAHPGVRWLLSMKV